MNNTINKDDVIKGYRQRIDTLENEIANQAAIIQRLQSEAIALNKKLNMPKMHTWWESMNNAK